MGSTLFRVRQPLADNLSAKQAEAVCVTHDRTIFMLPVVKPESLFIDVAEQVKWLDRNIGSVQPTLQETPEILHAVRVDISTNIRFGVVDDLMNVLRFQSPIGNQFVREDVRSDFHVRINVAVKSWLVAILNDCRANLSAALKHSHNNRLTGWPAPLDLFLALASVHVASLTSDERFINFHFARQLAAFRHILHSQSNAMEHKPSSLLCHSNVTVNFPRTDAILTTRYEPHYGKPLIQTKRGIFKDRASLDAELRMIVARPALPNPTRCDEPDVMRSTHWANNAFRPAASNQIVQAVIGIGEVNNRFREGLGFVFACHELSMRQVA